MRSLFGLVLIAGLGLAGLAVFMARNYIAVYENELAQARALEAMIEPTVEIYVVEKQMAYGDQLKVEDVRLQRWPVAALPEGAFKKDDPLFPENAKGPRIVLRAMEKSEALMISKVTEPGEDAGITSRLERGMRAFAIEVDVTSGVSGFLRPGHRVDVYWTGRLEGLSAEQSREVTKLIETGVSLMAVDQMADSGASAAVIARTVTVAVTPQQVASLTQAQSSGRLTLSLVGHADDTVASAVEVDQRSLLGIAAEAAPMAAPQRQVCTIRTRKGADMVELPIPCTN
jgi:pilus assembly protein CpaB